MTNSSTSLPNGSNAQGTASTTSGVPSASVLTPPQSTPARVVTSQTTGGDDQFSGSDAPYAIAQATPTCSEAAMKPIGTLPPIATSRPLGHISEIQSHLPGGSNIPLNNDAGHGNYNGNPPYVTVMTMAPSAVMSGADADLDDSRFQFLQRTRWMAAIMLAYYLATFFFVQPFLIGAMGIATGFIGYMSARPPVDFRRIKWVRWYVWLNYAMLGLNMWLLVIAFIAIGTTTSTDNSSADDDDDSSGSSWMADTSSYSDFSTYYTTNLGVYVGVLVGANMVMHLRGMRTAQLLLAELVAVGFAQPIVATAAPV
jgi:hypothetical protein